MKVRRSRFARLACACVMLAACSGESASRPASVVPAAGAPGSVAPPGAIRRTLSTVCSTNGLSAVVAGGAGNVAGGNEAGVLAGDSNKACDNESAIAGGNDNVISGTMSEAEFIGAGEGNSVAGDGLDSAIVGGYDNTLEGSSTQAAVGGGYGNAINGGNFAVIAGGKQNTVTNVAASIMGGAHNANGGYYAAIAGGVSNTITSAAEGGYIGNGGYNTVSGEGAVIDGGFNSTAAGTFATIPGGYVNNAAGTYSFAAGARASAAQNGTFVWSDGSDGDTILSSTQAYQFLARASGGFTLYTNPGSTVGAQLAPGSGTWASLSDRNAKTNIVPLDDQSVLAKVEALPISRWSYRTEHGVRHVGPMAQDFYAAFGVGEDDKHITSIDEDGVALAAIKALVSARNADRRASATREHALRAQLAALKADDLRRDAVIDAAMRRDAVVDAELSRLRSELAAVRRQEGADRSQADRTR